MTEHTPGPWRYNFWGSGWCVLHKGGDLTTVLAEVGDGFETPNTAQANARLIAAAPDMLTLLKRMLHFQVIANDEIRAVIAKAEGES